MVCSDGRPLSPDSNPDILKRHLPRPRASKSPPRWELIYCSCLWILGAYCIKSVYSSPNTLQKSAEEAVMAEISLFKAQCTTLCVSNGLSECINQRYLKQESTFWQIVKVLIVATTSNRYMWYYTWPLHVPSPGAITSGRYEWLYKNDSSDRFLPLLWFRFG